MGKLYEIFGADAHEMTVKLLEASQAADRIPKDGTVLLKPNLVLASPPEQGATTHSGVLSGCIEYLQAHGIRDICIAESSWVGARTEQAMKASGYDKVCQRYNVPFYDLKKDRTRTVKTPLRPMEICCRPLDADFLINLPVLKGHCQTRMTCALKNCKGCLPDREKRRFHTEGLMRPIAALASALKPDLTIADSICGDLDFEEGGNPVQTNRMYLGADPVQVDAYGCRLMGLTPDDVPYLAMAERWGAGSMKLSPSDIVRLNEPSDSASYPAASGTVKQLTRRVRADGACSACYASLVRALYEARKEGLAVTDEIAIGQGWKGKRFPGLGVGNCCAGADEHCKGCPPTAADALAFLKARG